jgi:hypothetical protein
VRRQPIRRPSSPDHPQTVRRVAIACSVLLNEAASRRGKGCWGVASGGWLLCFSFAGQWLTAGRHTSRRCDQPSTSINNPFHFFCRESQQHEKLSEQQLNKVSVQ